MKVEQFLHANQFHIFDNDNDILQSYSSTVVSIHHYKEDNSNIDIVKLGKNWNYSKTTLIHVYQFLEKYSNIIIPYNTKNKKAYIQKLIDNNEIEYDGDMI